MAASAATANAGPARPCSSSGVTAGKAGVGSALGSVPMRGMSRRSSSAAAVAATTAIRLAGSVGWILGSNSIMSTTPATTASVMPTVGQVAAVTESQAATAVFSPGVLSVPVARGTCCRKMMVPMPSVNPSTTGQGMKATARPRRLTPSSTTITPAMRLSRAMLPTPWAATIGASTTTMAPVGPETWTCEPPMTAATRPATTAVTRPAAAPTPEETPKARARGRATMPTVMPAKRSLRHVRGNWV